MSRKIIGVTVGTPISPSAVKDKLNLATEEWVKKGFQPSLVDEASGEVVALDSSADAPFAGLKLYGKTTQNGTPTPDAPVALDSVGDDGSVAVTVCSKNLVDVFNENMSVMRDGRTSATKTTVNADGSLVINVNGSMSYGQGFTKSLVAGQTVTISYIADSFGNGSGLRFRVYDTNDYQTEKATLPNNTPGKFAYTFTAPVDSVYMFGWYVTGSSSVPAGAKIHNLQLEFGDTATEYELYKEAQTLALATASGLSGIPVSSGGNYTDENGQQWVCDEVDFRKGQYVQRVGRIESYSGEAISSDCMSTTGALSNGSTVLYALTVPVETELPAELLSAYTALHTNYPNTTIYTDEGAGMEVKYVADTKLYIDNKFAELANAMLNN